MKKPDLLVQLLSELHSEETESEVLVTPESKAIIFVDDDHAADEDGLELTAEECRLLLANTDTIERMIDALNCPGEASLCLFDLGLSPGIIDRLERHFSTVDEG